MGAALQTSKRRKISKRRIGVGVGCFEQSGRASICLCFLFDVINQYFGWFMSAFTRVTHLTIGVFSPLKPSNPQWDAFLDEGNEFGALAA